MFLSFELAVSISVDRLISAICWQKNERTLVFFAVHVKQRSQKDEPVLAQGHKA